MPHWSLQHLLPYRRHRSEQKKNIRIILACGRFHPVVYSGPLIFRLSFSSSKTKSMGMDEGKSRKVCGNTGTALDFRMRRTQYVAK